MTVDVGQVYTEKGHGDQFRAVADFGGMLLYGHGSTRRRAIADLVEQARKHPHQHGIISIVEESGQKEEGR